MTDTIQLLSKHRILLRHIVLSELPASLQPIYLSLIDSIIYMWKKMIKNRGIYWTVIYFKEARLVFTRKLSGLSERPEGIRSNIGISKSGFPKILRVILPRLSGVMSPEELRVVMTLLTIGRTIITSDRDPDPSIDSITQESKATTPFDVDDFTSFVRRRLKKTGHIFPTLSHDNLHTSVKRGPNGPAMRTYESESRLFKANPVLLDALEDISPGIKSKLENFIIFNEKSEGGWATSYRYKDIKHPYYAKLVVIPDKESKKRVVCLLNYWAQTALKPLHVALGDLLRRFPYDCTYDHGRFKSWLRKVKNNSYHSIDLSNATDRFPLYIQEIVLKELIGDRATKAWSLILNQEIVVPWLNTTVKYSVGQPMGAYSSWPAFALTHGLVVSYLAEKCGARESHFCILGDDIVISNDNLASRYRSFLKQRDIPFSEAKTMCSKSTYEFAKRWIHNDVEITPFPLPSDHEFFTSYYFLKETFRLAEDRGWFLKSTGSGPRIVKNYLLELKLNRSFVRNILKSWRLFAFLPCTYLSPEENMHNWIRLCAHFGLSGSCVNYRSFATQNYSRVMGEVMGGMMMKAVLQWGGEFAKISSSRDSLGLPTIPTDDFRKAEGILLEANPHLCAHKTIMSDVIELNIRLLPMIQDGLQAFTAKQTYVRVKTLEHLCSERKPKTIARANSLIFKEVKTLLRGIRKEESGEV